MNDVPVLFSPRRKHAENRFDQLGRFFRPDLVMASNPRLQSSLGTLRAPRSRVWPSQMSGSVFCALNALPRPLLYLSLTCKKVYIGDFQNISLNLTRTNLL